MYGEKSKYLLLVCAGFMEHIQTVYTFDLKM